MDVEKEDSETGLQLAAAALKSLNQCCDILASMYNMPACPVFHAAHWYVSTTNNTVRMFSMSILQFFFIIIYSV